MPHSHARGRALASLARADPPADHRADRFAAALTGLVALGVLLTSSEALFAAQAVVFALGAFVGPRYAPYPALYRALVARPRAARSRPGLVRLVGPACPEPPELPALVRAGRAMGFGLAVLGTLGYLTGLSQLGTVAAWLVLAASVAATASGVHPGSVLHRALSQVFPRLVRHPSHPDTQQGAIA